MGGARVERHFINRVGWLRAAVLGANDGIISTASLMVGVASAATSSPPDATSRKTSSFRLSHDKIFAEIVKSRLTRAYKAAVSAS